VKLGLIGDPVGHSLSPAMQNAALRALGIDGCYAALAVAPADLAAVVRGLAANGYRGVNVTVPHKQPVLALLDHVTAEARAIGAVNTIVVEADGRLVGYNTDWSGFAADLATQQIDVRGVAAAVLGAGGAARAVAYALARQGAHVHVYSRTPAAAAVALVRDLRAQFPGVALEAYGLGELAAAGAALIVNATPAGMAPDVAGNPWPAGVRYPPGVPLYDLVYNPRVTALMRQAQAAGGRAFNGLGMLVRQGAAAFELWTGGAAPLAVMFEAVAA
jgi:shikimate dehydrogenase